MIRLLFALEAIVDLAFGAALLVAPDGLLALYGMTTDRDGTFFARFLGATLVGFGIVVWLARDWPDDSPRRTLVRALFLTTTLGFVVSLSYQLQPGAPLPAAAFVALTLVFAMAWGYVAARSA